MKINTLSIFFAIFMRWSSLKVVSWAQTKLFQSFYMITRDFLNSRFHSIVKAHLISWVGLGVYLLSLYILEVYVFMIIYKNENDCHWNTL